MASFYETKACKNGAMQNVFTSSPSSGKQMLRLPVLYFERINALIKILLSVC